MTVPPQRGLSEPPHPSENRQVYDNQRGVNGVVLRVLDDQVVLGPVDGRGAPWETNVAEVSLLFPLDTYPADKL